MKYDTFFDAEELKPDLIIDGHALMYRSYHAVKFAPMYNDMPVGMVYGFFSGLLNAISLVQPERIYITFDISKSEHRTLLLPEYKAQRTPAPDDFYAQIPLLKELIAETGLQICEVDGHEADDVIGLFAEKRKGERAVVVFSHDMDLTQLLVHEHVRLLRFAKIIDENAFFTVEKFKEKYGFGPEKLIDFKAIAGDPSDNYKGIPGIGEKGAQAMLQDYKDLEDIYDHIDDLKPAWANKFKEHIEAARKCRVIATLETGFDFNFKAESFLNMEKLQDVFVRMGFPSLNRRLQYLNKNNDQKNNTVQKNSTSNNTDEDQMALF